MVDAQLARDDAGTPFLDKVPLFRPAKLKM
jgi:hypothetical protein